MNSWLTAAFCAMLFMTQGCEKVRDLMPGKSGDSTKGASFNDSATELAEEDYEAFINQRGHLVVVNFGADWCGPCRQLGPVLERVSAEFGEAVKLRKVDVDKARSIAMRNGVRGIPDVRFFRDGKQVHQFSGAQPEARIRETFNNLMPKAPSKDLTPKKDEKPESLVQRLLPKAQPEEKDEAATEDEGPSIRPMEKDWLPPGIERR